MTDFEVQNSAHLILRKFWVVKKVANFINVLWFYDDKKSWNIIFYVNLPSDKISSNRIANGYFLKKFRMQLSIFQIDGWLLPFEVLVDSSKFASFFPFMFYLHFNSDFTTSRVIRPKSSSHFLACSRRPSPSTTPNR